jgi:hypothetical protein
LVSVPPPTSSTPAPAPVISAPVSAVLPLTTVPLASRTPAAEVLPVAVIVPRFVTDPAVRLTPNAAPVISPPSFVTETVLPPIPAWPPRGSAIVP